MMLLLFAPSSAAPRLDSLFDFVVVVLTWGLPEHLFVWL